MKRLNENKVQKPMYPMNLLIPKKHKNKRNLTKIKHKIVSRRILNIPWSDSVGGRKLEPSPIIPCKVKQTQRRGLVGYRDDQART
jgi:hypothetical protein